MKPVLIFRHIPCEGPGYLATFLAGNDIPYTIIDPGSGAEIPVAAGAYSGLVFMGGPMSANDRLPWIAAELELIRNTYRQNIPILGHCLGGQLISKALGGSVRPNAVTEIGWYPVRPLANHGQPWLQGLDFDTEIFHWHSEMFIPPQPAVPLFSSEHCPNQGFKLDKVLALQFHVEIERRDIPEWLKVYANDIPAPCASVQDSTGMLTNIESRISRLHQFADRIYTQWLNGFSE